MIWLHIPVRVCRDYFEKEQIQRDNHSPESYNVCKCVSHEKIRNIQSWKLKNSKVQSLQKQYWKPMFFSICELCERFLAEVWIQHQCLNTTVLMGFKIHWSLPNVTSLGTDKIRHFIKGAHLTEHINEINLLYKKCLRNYIVDLERINFQKQENQFKMT